VTHLRRRLQKTKLRIWSVFSAKRYRYPTCRVCCLMSGSLFAQLASQESRLIASLLDEERQVAHVTCDVWRVTCDV
jgi:hypothetical protein